MSESFTPHRCTLKVRGFHLDFYGHVNNARYLEFLEEARWSFADDYGYWEPVQRSGLDFAIVNINIDYRRAAKLHDSLSIETAMQALKRRNAVMRQRIYAADTQRLVAEATITFVLVSREHGHVVSIVDPIKACFESLPTWPQAKPDNP